MQAEVVLASRATANHRALGVIPCHEMCHGAVANNPNTHRLMSKTASRFSIRHFCPFSGVLLSCDRSDRSNHHGKRIHTEDNSLLAGFGEFGLTEQVLG